MHDFYIPYIHHGMVCPEDSEATPAAFYWLRAEMGYLVLWKNTQHMEGKVQWGVTQIRKAPIFLIYANWTSPDDLLHSWLFSIQTPCNWQCWMLLENGFPYVPNFWPESIEWMRRYRGNKIQPYMDPASLVSLYWDPMGWSIPLFSESLTTSKVPYAAAQATRRSESQN